MNWKQWSETVSQKELVQALIITTGIILAGNFVFEMGIMPSVLLGGSSLVLPLIAKINAIKQAAEKRLKHLICISPAAMNQVLMLIYGGTHAVNSLIACFEDLAEDEWIGEVASGFVSDLKTGIALEGAILNFNLELQYKPLGKMLQRLALYEKTGNALILDQLKQDLVTLNEEKYTFLTMQMNQADLASMLPSLIHLLILMVIFMSPILLGGMQL